MLSCRVRIPLHNRGINRNHPFQFLPRHHLTRYLLRSRPLPLRSIHGSSIRYFRRIHLLIPPNNRTNQEPILTKIPLHHHIYRSQPHFLPSTFLRIIGYAPSVLRLPRRILYMKYSIIIWVHNLICRVTILHFHLMRSICRST